MANGANLGARCAELYAGTLSASPWGAACAPWCIDARRASTNGNTEWRFPPINPSSEAFFAITNFIGSACGNVAGQAGHRIAEKRRAVDHRTERTASSGRFHIRRPRRFQAHRTSPEATHLKG